ncbi:MAG: hypothetical protein MI739_07905 [Bacteroidales bacterium]|nr:hypothetical protein [Bacteroidales bacterium]
MIRKFCFKNASILAIVFILISVTFLNFSHHRWLRSGRVIEWDIKSYYAYLPATFIYKDLSLQFRKDNIEKFGDLIWPIETPTGKHAIVTSMGLSFMYAPFFGIAHIYCLNNSEYDADGYTMPYKFALVFSSLIYVIIGLFFLRKILKKFFSEDIATIVILAIGIGTNLLYYYSYEAAMSHAYNFTLITIFLWQIIRFYERPNSSKALLIGLNSGLITLIRPTNILVLIILFFWNISSFSEFKTRVIFYIKKYKLTLIMMIAFILVWIPQFLYWYKVSGKIFYFSYGAVGGKFFFNNPQISNILISYKKGWFIYTPIMFIAFIGIFALLKTKKEWFSSIFIFFILNTYILASWWCWWFGGSFGHRAFIDSYGIMALPLAALLNFTKQKRILYHISIGCIFLLIVFNNFQIQQYYRNAIHYWWMNKDAYWETFLKLYPTERYKQLIVLPDYEKAREGIYVGIKQEYKKEEKIKILPSKQETIMFIKDQLAVDSSSSDSLLLKEAEDIYLLDSSKYKKQLILNNLEKDIRHNKSLMEDIAIKAKRRNIELDSMVTLDAIWLYNKYGYNVK